ncbi:hypothetical protein [Aliarcobacter butzleri]|uniref:hypothetical protein n=1 Tax=Aliarcobacter butzleri TaxID=28197 RepID=UPI002B243D82|nr:hypothetical protein [Aliarcobacter butzleri]
MGSIITAKCNKCDFIKKGIKIGCGMTNHKVFEGYPYSCNECNDFFQGNYKDPNLCCPSCSSKNVVIYSEHKLNKEPEPPKQKLSFFAKLLGKKEIERLPQFDIHAYYKCPKCNEFTMQFYQTALYD